MLKTYLYIPEYIAKEVKNLAENERKSKAEILRSALEQGISVLKRKRYGGAEALLKIVELGKKYKVKGPRDASINHDYYLWGLPKKKQKKP
ncbi:hypothetical protein HYW87_05020 [Candidatus Roizmanbacteria bacterium]|nr:hypothetical protein [Candidatus Roizmanbacteria bacterium]